MSDTNKTDKQESSGFFMNPMKLYGVGGIPFPVFTPQFGPMVPLRMMAPMLPMNTPFMQPYMENFSGSLSKPLSDTQDNTPTTTDQPGGKTVPFMWPMNAAFMQEYMKSMNVLKSSSDASSSPSSKSSAGTVMAPMWPMNAAFMQQHMEGFGQSMPNPVVENRAAANQATSKDSAKNESVVVAEAAPSSMIQLREPSGELLIKNKVSTAGCDDAVKVDGVSVDKPKMDSTNHSTDKMAKMTFPPGSTFAPFSNIAGFIPYTTYIPYFKPVDMSQGGSSEKEQQVIEPSKIQAQGETESSSPVQSTKEEKSSSIPIKGKEESVVVRLKNEPSDNNEHQHSTEKSLPDQGGCAEAGDTGNSAEMDVAQILVNFMPVPVIGNASQEDVDDRSRQEDASITVMEEGTAPLAAPEVDLDVTMDINHEPDLPSEVLPRSVAHKVITEELQESLKSNKVHLDQARLSGHKSPEVTSRVDSMEVSVIKSSKDVVMEMQESNMVHDTSVLGGKAEEPAATPERHSPTQVAMEKQATQHVDKEQPTEHVFEGQVSNQTSEGQVSEGHITPSASKGQVIPCISEVAPVLQVKQEYDSTIDQYHMNGSPGDISDTNGDIPKMAKVTYKCEVCSQLFRSSLGLQKHLEFHTDDGQHYTCTICFELFQDSTTLQEHIAFHMRKRPHKCQFCPKAFRDPGSLQKHVRVHTGEKPYKCTNCFRSFAEYSSLRKHLRVHTGEQPYKCQYCSKAFSISGNLQRHVLIHTGERPYKCSFCPKAFNNPSHLRRHVKNLHFKGEGGSGADVMIAMAAAVAAAEGKIVLGNGETTDDTSLASNNVGSSSASFTDIVPYEKERDQSAVVDQSLMIKMDLPVAISQPVNIS